MQDTWILGTGLSSRTYVLRLDKGALYCTVTMFGSTCPPPDTWRDIAQFPHSIVLATLSVLKTYHSM